MDRFLTAAQWNSERAAWLPIALWSHGRELAFVISRVLEEFDGETPTAEHDVLGLLALIRSEWRLTVSADATLPELPQLGAFISRERLALLVHR